MPVPGLSVYNVQIRPNPFRESTAFFFEHNKPGSELDVMIHDLQPDGTAYDIITICRSD